MTTERNDIRHHLDDATLTAYSAGSLPEAFGLIVASHVSMCDDCRARLESFDSIGGALLATVGSDALAPGALDRTLALIDADPTPPPAPPQRDDAILPAPLRDYVGGDIDAIRWRSVGMGVRQAVLSTSKSATARLLYIPAGAAMPDHGHRGVEMTLVLQGAFEDETDRFARGDIEIANEATHHTPVADISADCICLAVTDAPLRFRGLIPRLAQPFLGI